MAAVATAYPDVKIGMRIRFAEEKGPYSVRAVSPSGRFAVCMKPFNLRHTTLYTVIDFAYGVRGTENLVFSRGCEGDLDAIEMAERLESGETEVSYRNWVWATYDVSQPDKRVRDLLPSLVAATDAAFAENPNRQNAPLRTKPWAVPNAAQAA